jgi:hypothetical protein
LYSEELQISGFGFCLSVYVPEQNPVVSNPSNPKPYLCSKGFVFGLTQNLVFLIAEPSSYIHGNLCANFCQCFLFVSNLCSMIPSGECMTPGSSSRNYSFNPKKTKNKKKQKQQKIYS